MNVILDRYGFRDGKWNKVETIVEAKATNHFSSLQITTTMQGSYLLDQVSAMPLDTYMGHGFRKDLFQMVADLKPKFLRFPGTFQSEGLLYSIVLFILGELYTLHSYLIS
ncbi:hypothetical protein Fmac_029553 [Flemingia macrophylla]|uniref:Uncharacterized protein n=1 Tax=Flemingia macrophylla TaxID=520843 RepID=A0ABD1LAQ3_9FABA